MLIASWFGPFFTELAVSTGLAATEGGAVSALYIGNVFDFVITKLSSFGVIGFGILAVITVGTILFVRKKPLQE